VLDPSTTECPVCGVHDTRIAESSDDGQTAHVCNACGARFVQSEDVRT
jgi:transcriptional regulator NrdR family protein